MTTDRNLAAMARVLDAWRDLGSVLQDVAWRAPHTHQGSYEQAVDCAPCLAAMLQRQSQLRSDDERVVAMATQAIADREVEESELRRELLAFLKRQNQVAP